MARSLAGMTGVLVLAGYETRVTALGLPDED
jgi:hypothetical protein